MSQKLFEFLIAFFIFKEHIKESKNDLYIFNSNQISLNFKIDEIIVDHSYYKNINTSDLAETCLIINK